MPLGTEMGVGQGDIVLDGDPAPQRKGAQQPPSFRAMSTVAKLLPISATAELLFIWKLATTSCSVQLCHEIIHNILTLSEFI